MLDAALAALSREIGDPYHAGVDALARALFGAQPSTWAHVAARGGGIGGAVLFAPVFSTVRGGAGAFVSDLWVDSAERGNGLGGALLRAAAETAGALWSATFMRLSVHDTNTRADTFYRNLGFEPVTGETVMVLKGQAFQKMRRSS